MLDVCEQQGIPVVLQPPNVATIEKWQGALISSTSRLALPISEIVIYNEAEKEGTLNLSASTKIRRTFETNSLAQTIEALVLKEIEDRSPRVLA